MSVIDDVYICWQNYNMQFFNNNNKYKIGIIEIMIFPKW